MNKNFLIFMILLYNFFLFSQEPDLRIVIQTGNPGMVSRIATSKTGQKIASINMNNNFVKIWSRNGRLSKTLNTGNGLLNNELSFSDNEKYFAMTDANVVKIWNLDNDKMIKINGVGETY